MAKRKRLFIVTLEKIDKRYTKQWYETWRPEFKKYFNVVDYIDGTNFTNKIEKGRFLDINQTNYYKSVQTKHISEMFYSNIVEEGDVFLFMDGWHFGITALKYMAQLNNIPIKIFTYLHAGSWDKHDFISQAGLGKWAKYNEIGWLKACDGHFVATKFHKRIINNMFKKNKISTVSKKIHVVGFPMNWKKVIENELGKDYKMPEKEDIIVFPHRLDKEKQPEIFDKLKKQFPQYKFIKTIEVTKNKKEYYKLLSKAKISFSASLQETFGIGTVEAMMLNCLPLVPGRLSYNELYDNLFIYHNSFSLKLKLKSFMKDYNRKYNNPYKKTLQKNQRDINTISLNSFRKMSNVMLL